MNYQIKYDWTGHSQHISGREKWAKQIGLAVMMLLLGIAILWSMNADWAVTVDAMEDMATALQQGHNIKEAFSTFCLDILMGAEFG